MFDVLFVLAGWVAVGVVLRARRAAESRELAARHVLTALGAA